MPEQLTPVYEASPVEVSAGYSIENRRLRWFELGLVLFVSFGAFFPSVVYMLELSKSGSPYPQYAWGSGLVQETGCLLLLAYVLWRRNLRFRDIGLRWSLRNIAAGVGLAIVSYIAYSIGYVIVHAVHHALFQASSNVVSARQVFGHPPMTAIPFMFLNPFFEELIVRAFL